MSKPISRQLALLALFPGVFVQSALAGQINYDVCSIKKVGALTRVK
jgi:hypothetical protein